MTEPICPYCGDGPESVDTQNHIECVQNMMEECLQLRRRLDEDCTDCATGIERYMRERLEDSLDEEREKNRQLHEQIVELIMRAERAEKGAEQASQAKPRVHCRQCCYWDCEETTDRGYRLGTCHYNPPTVCVLGNRVLEMPSYPATYGYEWCGRGEKGENREVECG